MKNFIIFLSIQFFLLTIFVYCDETDYMDRSIIITCSSNLPPYSFLDNNNEPKGALIDFWELWGEKTGLQVDFKLTNWNRTLDLVKKGEVDIHSGLFNSKIKEEYLDYTIDFTSLSAVIFVQARVNIDSMNDLIDQKVPVVRGSFEEEYMNKNYSNINIELFDDYENLVKYSIKDNYLAFVADYPVGMYFIEKHGDIDQFKVLQRLYTTELRGAVKEGDKNLLKIVNDGLYMISEEENKLVFQKWVRSEEILPAWLIPGLIIIGIFIFLSFIFSIIFILKVQVRRKTNELKLANKKIEATAIQRQRLFQSLAHELKTPLTLIKNYLEQDISKRGSTKDLDIVHKNVGKLINEVVKYMDVSKIERDHFKFNHNQLIDLTSFIESKVEHFEKAAKTKSISLCMELEKAVFIEADPSAIDKVMNNLLDNALKFMGKGNITVMLCKINDNIVDLVVRDTGPGIPESQLENIFKPYYQMLPEKGHYYGMGMGLYIVKSIMDSIGSTIIVKSKIGEGTIFTISFKIVRTSNEENIVKCIESSYSDGIPTVIKKLKEKNIAEDKLNILIIEDNLEMLDFLQSAFKENYNVYLATNGKEAIDKLENISMPEIIISDMMMPIMDGEVFLSKLLENENCKNIPLIFLTARTTDNEKIKALSEGAFDYIYKPFNIEELKAKVKTIIKNKKSVIQNNSDNIKDKMLEYFESINNIKELKKENNFDGMCFKYKITKKEYEIMKLISEGLYSKEIAGKLNCSTRTVENHISHIYSKIGVSGRVELVNFINNFN